MTSLKFDGYAIVTQEVPTEISLAFNISNCPHHCPGCHSKYLWEDVGLPLVDNMTSVLDKYSELITCVCFMGGEQNLDDLEAAIQIAKNRDLKVCLYTGSDSTNGFASIIPLLDYLKIGHFDEELGGLDSKTTNQRMFKFESGKYPQDITSSFWKEKI